MQEADNQAAVGRAQVHSYISSHCRWLQSSTAQDSRLSGDLSLRQSLLAASVAVLMCFDEVWSRLRSRAISLKHKGPEIRVGVKGKDAFLFFSFLRGLKDSARARALLQYAHFAISKRSSLMRAKRFIGAHAFASKSIGMKNSIRTLPPGDVDRLSTFDSFCK